MGTTTTTFTLNKPTVGGDDNAWGTDWNTNADKIDDLLDGTTAIKPNLSEGLWKVGGTAVTSTAAELNFTDGVTSAIQTQLDAKQATDADLTAIAGLSSSGIIARTGAGTAAARTVTAGTGIAVTNGDGVSGNPTVAADLASQAEAEAGTDNTKVMTPLRVAQSIAALSNALLGTLTTTSGTVQTLSGLDLTPYKFLHITVKGVSFTAVSANLNLDALRISNTSGAAADVFSGTVIVDLANGVMTSCMASATVVAGAVYTHNGSFSTATTSISFTGGTFDAGSILVYGVK